MFLPIFLSGLLGACGHGTSLSSQSAGNSEASGEAGSPSRVTKSQPSRAEDAGDVPPPAPELTPLPTDPVEVPLPPPAPSPSPSNLDKTPPPPLLEFKAEPKSGQFDALQLSVTFPADLTDYERAQIRRYEGATAGGCDQGVSIKDFSKGAFASGSFDDKGIKAGLSYSYRACLTDAAGNSTSDQMVQGVSTPPCGGAVVGPFCWYAGGANGRSCNSVCADRGGVTEGTITYTGTAGTLAQCQAVLDAVKLGSGRAVDYTATGYAQGCVVAQGARRRYILNKTQQGDTGPVSERVCSCAL